MAKDNDLAKAFLLIVGAAVLADALNPKCPICKNKVAIGNQRCPVCGTYLRWP